MIFLASADINDTPPKLTSIKISNVASTSVIVTWNTDKQSDSLVNYSLDKNYGISRDPSFTHTSHQVLVDNLKPNTTYFFRVISSDTIGNQAISGDYSFTTLTSQSTPSTSQAPPQPAEQASGQGEQQSGGQGGQDSGFVGGSQTGDQGGVRQGGQGGDQASQKITQDVIDQLSKITNPEDLAKISQAIDSVAGGILNPPAVLGAAPQVDTGPDYAVIKWVTDRNSDSIVALAPEKDFNPNADNPYTWKTGEGTDMTLQHEVRVINLAPATIYHYQILSTPEVGPAGKSQDYNFKTKSILPEIYNLKIAKLEETAATLTWNTNVPAKAVVEYTDLSKKETKLAGNSTLATSQQVRLNDLTLNTTYSAIVHVENEQGDKTDSYRLTFTTVKDILPPVISKVNTESTIYPGSDAKIQTIISWETDELAVCQFFYQEGIMANKEPNTQPKETDYTTKHIQVVTAFTQATVYKYWIKCDDHTGNEGVSDSFSILTPAQEQSIIDLILANFQSTFGWLNKKN